MPAQPAPVSTPQSTEPPYPSRRYAWYVVGVLTLVYVFSFIDRQILSLLVRPLRRDLGITDTQVSILMGFSIAVFYTICGIPLGRLADTRSRRSIVAGGLVFWSIFTSLCGVARNFMQMLLCRIGVGVGEAALSPSAYSLITDYFPREQLGTAIGVYSMGIYIGAGLSFLLGGIVIRLASVKDAWILPLVGEVRPWQVIFLAVGLPGILVAPLIYTIREPVRRGLLRQASSVPAAEAFRYMLEQKGTFLCHTLGFGLLALASYASSAWVPEYFRRSFHWDIPHIGIVYGSLVIVFGSLGVAGAGKIADLLRKRGILNANMRVGMWIALIGIPVCLLLYLAPSSGWATLWLAPGCIVAAAPFGIAPAAIQQMMPNSMRGQASAVYLFIINLIGLGLGPTAVALCTQYVFKRDDAVNLSLLAVQVTAMSLGAILLGSGLKPFLRSLERLGRWTSEQRSA
ncbi:MAG TPA: MFS transporter [Bryobacteraceae bacterium]|nr:MFS transporter [Bryobacteraceae bacterium]